MSDFKYKFVKKCQICKNSNLSKIHSFGYHPTVNNFLKTGKDNSKKYFNAMVVYGKLKKRYKELKAQEFPNIQSMFNKKYGAQIKELKKKKEKG